MRTADLAVAATVLGVGCATLVARLIGSVRTFRRARRAERGALAEMIERAERTPERL